MITPNLNCCASILWTMIWLDCSDLGIFVVPIFCGVSNILEGAVQRNGKSNLCGFLFRKWWTVFALDTELTTFELATFPLKVLNVVWSAWNVRSANDHISELAMWLWVLLLELGEWSTVHDDLRVARGRTLRRINIFNLDSWFSAL